MLNFLFKRYQIINDARNEIVISGVSNYNYPWMSELNGKYKYVYDGSRVGYNNYMFRKGNLVLTHLFDENRYEQEEF